ncbi:proline-rich receptor-like protein kinase PERK1 [Ananas comosus]|uniref:non-specific serine/threonine protein kinase n=1 Tax=Ananas comosus TaxID=4615 RepID=A0A6P5FP12_ANACO|nr:proline-rich receptor-like protein kinase PERK1 [Ananas comosus]
MPCNCDFQKLKPLLRFPLAFLALGLSACGCATVLVGLVGGFIFRRCELPKVIVQLGLLLMEAPCFVLRTFKTTERSDGQTREVQYDTAPWAPERNESPSSDHVVKMLPIPTPPPSFSSPPPHAKVSNIRSANSLTPSIVVGYPNIGFSRFTYEELAAATGGFTNGNLLGEGGFAYVHKGRLTDGREVAVKQLKAEKGWAESDFHVEVDVISHVHHKHLVSLIGCCITKENMLLVLEYVPNKTLHHHLHGKGKSIIDWPTRLKIAVGSARGLAYLHEECQPRIVHRDIKAANILLDHSFEAKVADFGIAKFINDGNTHVSTRIMGTIGYLAPEYASTGQLTDKSDVFSFGVMLLELITGRQPVMRSANSTLLSGLVDWARPLLTRALHDGNYDALVDPRLATNYDPNEMKLMVACAAACVQHSAPHRPRMSQVVQALEGVISLEDLINDAAQHNQIAIQISDEIFNATTSSTMESWTDSKDSSH